MRQRLLEKDDLSLEAALEQAYSWERAQQQSSYSINVAASNVVLHRQRSAESLAGADVGSVYDPVSDPLPHGLAAAVENKRCYFCGRPYQKRSRCPARNVTCHTCQKKGHYARVCKSKDKPLSSRAAALLKLSCLGSRRPA